jgi:signal transduction histidine kinase
VHVNPATVIPLVASTLNLSAAIMLAVIARAPGWPQCRTYAAVAFTAALYSLTSVVLSLPGLETTTYLWYARAAYFTGHANAAIWLCFAFGGPDASWRAMPRAVRIGFVLSLACGGVLFLSGIHMPATVHVISANWSAAWCVVPIQTLPGTAYGVVIWLHFVVSFGQLIRRQQRGEQGIVLQVVAFAVFTVAAAAEVMTVFGTWRFVSLGDIGMAIVVLPVTVRVIRRFVADAEQLHAQTGQLKGEVREQTEWRDRAQVAFVESERMASLGRMAAGVGHEINNPLTYLMLSLGEIEEHLVINGAPSHVLASIEHARDGAARIQKVAERLRSVSRRHDARAPLDLRDVVAAAVRVAGPELLPDVHVDCTSAAVRRILGDEPRLVQAVVNVLVNAAQAVKPRPGAHAIEIRISEGPIHEVVLTVRDNGVGIPAEHLDKMGEPYFTTRAHAGGLGLGLFMTRGIVHANGGRMAVASVPNEGTTVTLTFPGLDEALVARRVSTPSPTAAVAATAPVAVPAAQVTPANEPDKKPSVLVIDDEPLVLKLLDAILRKGWEVTTVPSAADALQRLGAARFDAVVCDLMMPGMSGIELAREVERKDPELRRRMLFLTGGAVTIEAEDFLARPDVRHMTKPVTRTELHATLIDLAGRN